MLEYLVLTEYVSIKYLRNLGRILSFHMFTQNAAPCQGRYNFQTVLITDYGLKKVLLADEDTHRLSITSLD